jgi:hypothetical protein
LTLLRTNSGAQIRSNSGRILRGDPPIVTPPPDDDHPFVSQSKTLGALVVYMADDIDTQTMRIPDKSGHAREDMRFDGPVVSELDRPAGVTKVLVFDGVDDAAWIPYGPWMDLSNNFTIVSMSKHTGQALMWLRLFGRANSWWGVTHDGGSSTLRMYGYTANSSTSPTSGKTDFLHTTNIPTGWTLWGHRDEGNQIRLYTDGVVKVSRSTVLTPGVGADDTSTESFQLGHRYRNSTGQRDHFWGGRWAALAIFPSVLSSGEQATLTDNLKVSG